MKGLARARLGVIFVCASMACGARSALRDPVAIDAGLDAPPAVDVPMDLPVDVSIDLPVDVSTDLPRDVVEDRRPDVEARVDVVCPAPIDATEGTTATLIAMASSSVGLPLALAWTVDRAPAGSTAAPTPSNSATARFAFDTGGDWLLRFTARDPLGNSASCVVRASSTPAIELLCPNEQSNYQGATVPLVASATSRLGLPLTLAWSVVSRPTSSRSAPSPTDLARSTLSLDALGDWRVQLTARDTAGHTAACVTRVHADPDVIVTCPPDVTARPFTTTTLGATARSRLGLDLATRWEVVERPVTSTASLTAPASRSTDFSFDVAGRWTWRFTARNDRGGEASCTTRGFALSTEAVRVELVWNLDRSCATCNAEGGGLDLDLHLSDPARSGGHWNGDAPGNTDCYWENCKCTEPGFVCADGVLDWPPAGAINNPQLDTDQNTQLPGPENINVLTASAGARFDVGVHFFGDNTRPVGTQRTAAVVRVYCAGAVVFESEPVTLGPVRTPSVVGVDASGNPLWRVGQVIVGADGCRFERCGRPGDVAACIRPARDW